ncbi:MAG TPA: hypothetical protein PLM07_05950 [Candidatus Rifleibacterium sp.]|nr:hypothetical protein [Candidatus Rifleibacterium sp.]HPT45423.1 hypothetical protein [Candidatus Rifleibacterium sp.]
MNRKVLFVAPVVFNRLKQRHQAFATELAQSGFSVDYLEPSLSPGWSLTTTLISDRLTLLHLKVPFKAASYPALQKISIRLFQAWLCRFRQLDPHATILWLADPSMAALAGISWQTVIYDRCDLHGAFPGQRHHAWKTYESFLASRASIISVSHPFLARGMPENTLLAPNACSEEFVARGCQPALNDQGKRVAAAAKIRLVSSGAHYEWVDCDWLAMLAELAGAELHIAGSGRGSAFEKLISKSNVVYHGHLEPGALQQLLLSCHIGLIPFKNLELINGVDPIKAYEYAACHLEVWAPDLPSLHANPMISRFIAGPMQAAAALQQHRFGPQVFSGRVPVWGERLQTILDRMAVLRSD